MAVYVKRGGSWVEAGCGQARHSGSWRDTQEVWVKHEGAWNKVCSKALNVGDLYGGGVYAGQISYGGDTYNLVIPENVYAEYIRPNYQRTWKNSGVGPDPGATSDYDGMSNSNAINDSNHPAAQFCRSLEVSGFSDWYLPSKEELRLIHTNKAALGLGTIGHYVWSSTQHTQTQYAWAADFSRASGVELAMFRHAKDAINTKSIPVRRVKTG